MQPLEQDWDSPGGSGPRRCQAAVGLRGRPGPSRGEDHGQTRTQRCHRRLPPRSWAGSRAQQLPLRSSGHRQLLREQVRHTTFSKLHVRIYQLVTALHVQHPLGLAVFIAMIVTWTNGECCLNPKPSDCSPARTHCCSRRSFYRYSLLCRCCQCQ